MLGSGNLFDRFGGIRPMALALNKPPSTVQSWKNTGRVPATEQPMVLQRANDLELDVTANDVVFPLQARPLGQSSSYGQETARVDCDPSSPLQDRDA